MNKLIVVPIMVLILLLIDFYIFQGTKAAFGELSNEGKKWLNIIYWGISGLLISGIIAYNFADPALLGRTFRSFIMVVVFMVYFAKIIMLPFVLIDDLIRLGKWIYSLLVGGNEGNGLDGTPISRSEFLGRLGLGIASVPVIGMLYGIVAGAHDYRVRKESVWLPNLPSAFDGLKILQISDVHSGSFFNKEAVRRGIRMIQEQKADVVFFTGDLVNNTADEMENYADIFGEISAPMGVFSVLGNHDYGDYYRWNSTQEKEQNLQRLKDIQAGMGWRLLLNEHVRLEKEGENIAIIGIENWGLGGFSKHGDLAKAYKGAEDAPVKLLLSHDPSHWNAEVTQQFKDIDLAFAGHTHGMQFGIEKGDIKWSPVQYRYEQWGGLYQKAQQYLYVNRGFGYIGYPGRIGMPPEITVIELKKGNV